MALLNSAAFNVRIDGVTMEPTLPRNSFVMVSKLAYTQQGPQRGDIIVYKPPTAPTRMFIHRIIGLPGEQLRMMNGRVTINGTALDEPYSKTSADYEGEWKLDRGQYFVLGDNRTNSLDSHTWGALPGENILGKAMIVYWPPTHWAKLTGTNYSAVP